MTSAATWRRQLQLLVRPLQLEGFEALFQIRDNGEGGRGEGPDFMSPVLLHEVGVGPNCLVPSEFDLVPVKGNFRVEE